MLNLKQFELKHLKPIAINSLKSLKILLPIFFIAVLLGVLIEMYVPSSSVEFLLGKNLFIAIPLAAIIGILLPIPRYATYPIAFALFLKGAGVGVVFALIAGEVIGESIIRDFMEIKYLGWKFFTARFFITTIFIIIGGFLMEVLM
ncbi:hypothetical protein HOK51_03490 [Candidatus Woesearchaeota archaeon]|jgi:uncharacterized protein|nr:hypothetical protein [Candidatus Woesearchaeota archaeon]MBT6518884.1 hypothetical protein [Candidatus Woesearchaeota archaeon]MBT7368486.1 hypothetical protein [Candidatus Woesearchaeota archaeon]